MTGMDTLELRDINGPALKPKYGAIGHIVAWECKSSPQRHVALFEIISGKTDDVLVAIG